MKNIIYDEEFEIGHGSSGLHFISIPLKHNGKLNHKLHLFGNVTSDEQEYDIEFLLATQREIIDLFPDLFTRLVNSDEIDVNLEHEINKCRDFEFSVDIDKSQTMWGIFNNSYSQLTDKTIHAKIYETWDDDVSKNSVFVITPIGNSESDESWNIIKSECQKLNLKPERANNVIGSKSILENIVAKIKQSEFLIVDLTCEKPNVYYELGYAHGQVKKEENILLIAKKDTILHFDISPSNVEFYKSVNNLHDIIYNKIKNMMS
jgi:hypothetical protein